MSTLFGLTNYTEIISQLGIEKSEFKEDEFNSSGIQEELQLDLLQWFPSYENLASDNSADTSITVQRLALRVYCKVFCAEQIALTSAMRFVQQEGDGDNATKRFQSASSLADFKEGLTRKRAEMKATVLATSTIYTPEDEEVTVSINVMSIASPATDKILG